MWGFFQLILSEQEILTNLVSPNCGTQYGNIIHASLLHITYQNHQYYLGYTRAG